MKASTTAKRKADAEREKRRQAAEKKARRMLTEVRNEAAEFSRGNRTNIDPAQAIQDILDGAVASWRYANLQMLTLREDEYFEEQMGMTVPNAWIREEDRLGAKVLQIASRAAALGLAERKVALEEQQAMIFAAALDAVMTAVGIPADTRHKVHIGVARELEDVEAQGVAVLSQ